MKYKFHSDWKTRAVLFTRDIYRGPRGVRLSSDTRSVDSFAEIYSALLRGSARSMVSSEKHWESVFLRVEALHFLSIYSSLTASSL